MPRLITRWEATTPPSLVMRDYTISSYSTSKLWENKPFPKKPEGDSNWDCLAYQCDWASPWTHGYAASAGGFPATTAWYLFPGI